MEKRVMKSGGSLYVCIPNEVAEMWALKKGDEVRLNVVDGALRIEPKQPTMIEHISQRDVEAYSEAMQSIEARVTMDAEADVIHLEFRGGNQKAVKALVLNLWSHLPALLKVLGLGAVREMTSPADEGSS